MRDEGVRAIEIACGCGSFRWAPSENGDVGDRPLDALEAEAISLWNFQYGRSKQPGDRPERAD